MPHHSDFMEVFVVLNGKAVLDIGGEQLNVESNSYFIPNFDQQIKVVEVLSDFDDVIIMSVHEINEPPNTIL